MKFFKTLFLMLTISSILVSTAFAAPDAPHQQNEPSKGIIKKNNEKQRKEHKDSKKKEDPIKILKERKKKIESLRKEGKISDEKAKELTKKINERIKKVEEFKKLPLNKKKELLLQSFKVKLDSLLKAGEITQEQADEILKEFLEKLEKWDGSGYPGFHGKRKQN